jgi:hypothetical protein
MANGEGAKLAQAIHDSYNSRDLSGPESSIGDDFTWTAVPFGAGSKGVAGYREVIEVRLSRDSRRSLANADR